MVYTRCIHKKMYFSVDRVLVNNELCKSGHCVGIKKWGSPCKCCGLSETSTFESISKWSEIWSGMEVSLNGHCNVHTSWCRDSIPGMREGDIIYLHISKWLRMFRFIVCDLVIPSCVYAEH